MIQDTCFIQSHTILTETIFFGESFLLKKNWKMKNTSDTWDLHFVVLSNLEKNCPDNW